MLYKSECHFFLKVAYKFINRHSYLLHRVTVTDGYAAVVFGIEVVGDAVRSADFVLAAITLADGACVIKVDHKVLCKLVVHFKRLLAELFGERQHGGLERSKRRVQVQHGADVIIAHGLFVVCVAEERKGYAVCTEGGLDNVGDISLVGFRVKVVKGLTAEFAVLRKVVVGSVRNAPKLAPAEREQELEVGGSHGIEAQLLLGMVAAADVLLGHAKAEQPAFAVVFPVCEPVKVGAGLAEELKLHLLKLAGTEGEVAGSDFVTEGLAYLTDAERNFLSGGALNVLKVHENALRGFRTEINLALCVLGNALEGFEHKVKGTNVGEVLRTAVGAFYAFFVDESAHTVELPTLGVNSGLLLDKLVGSVAGFAVLAVHKRVGEAAHMTGSNPHLRVHKDSGVKTHVVGAFLNEGFPPGAFYVVFKLHAEGTVVPCVGKTAVYFRTCVNKSAVFAKCNDFIHCFVGS